MKQDMAHEDKSTSKSNFTSQGVWFGLLAYLVVACLIALIFIFG